MTDAFDAYHLWLGIPPEEQPPDHYRLLGIRRFESNDAVIAHAVDQRMAHIRTFQSGKRAAESQAILNRLASASLCLSSAKKKEAYDAQLRDTATVSPRTMPPDRANLPATAPPLPPPLSAPLTNHAAPPMQPPPVGLDPHDEPAVPLWNHPLVLAAGGAFLFMLLVLGIVVWKRGSDRSAPVALTPSSPTQTLVPEPAPTAPDPDNGEATAAASVDSHPGQPANDANSPATDFAGTPTGDSEGSGTALPSPALPHDPAPSVATVDTVPDSSQTDAPGAKPNQSIADVGVSIPAAPSNEDSAAGVAPAAQAELSPVAVIHRALGTVLDPPLADRQPLPSRDDQTMAMELVDDVFADKFEKVKTPEDRVALASILIHRADDPAESSASRLVMLQRAADLAVEAGEPEVALQSVEKLARAFEFDQRQTQFDTLGRLANKVKASQRKTLVDAALRLTRQCLTDLRFELADQTTAFAANHALRTNDSETRKASQQIKDEVSGFKRRWGDIPEVLERLNNTADRAQMQPADLSLVGKYLCLVRGNWRDGIMLIASGEEGPLRQLARREQALQAQAVDEDAESVASLADAWFDLSTGDADWEGFQTRAHHWYTVARNGLAGLLKVRAEKRIAETAKVAAEASRFVNASADWATDRAAAGQRLFMGEGIRLELAHDWSDLVGEVRLLAISPGSDQLAIGAGGAVDLWNPRSGLREAQLLPTGGQATGIAYSPDGKLLAVVGSNSPLEIWDTQKHSALPANAQGRLRTYTRLKALAFVDDKTVLLRDAASARTLLEHVVTRQVRTIGPNIGHHDAVSVSSGVAPLLAAAASNEIRVWAPDTGQMQANLSGHTQLVNATAFTRDGRTLISGGFDGLVMVWDWRTSRATQTLLLDGFVMSVAVSPDGQLVAAGNSKGLLRIWNVRSGRPLLSLRVHRDYLAALVFSPNGKQLISGGRDEVVRVWNLERSAVYAGSAELQSAVAETLSTGADSSDVDTTFADLENLPDAVRQRNGDRGMKLKD